MRPFDPCRVQITGMPRRRASIVSFVIGSIDRRTCEMSMPDLA